jgi:hypothetical protein
VHEYHKRIYIQSYQLKFGGRCADSSQCDSESDGAITVVLDPTPRSRYGGQYNIASLRPLSHGEIEAAWVDGDSKLYHVDFDVSKRKLYLRAYMCPPTVSDTFREDCWGDQLLIQTHRHWQKDFPLAWPEHDELAAKRFSPRSRHGRAGLRLHNDLPYSPTTSTIRFYSDDELTVLGGQWGYKVWDFRPNKERTLIPSDDKCIEEGNWAVDQTRPPSVGPNDDLNAGCARYPIHACARNIPGPASSFAA